MVEAQMEVAFQLGVRGILDDLKPTVSWNVEDSTRAVDPTLSKEEIWNSLSRTLIIED